MSNGITQAGVGHIALQGLNHSPVNITQLIGKSAEFHTLKERLGELEVLFKFVPQEMKLGISEQINQQKDLIKQFERDVLQLYEEFNRIEINTERLRCAKELFDDSQFDAARDVLKKEHGQMQDEQTRLLKERERFEKDILPKLINNSEEFLIFALSSRADYSNPNRFADTCSHFENSIKSYASKTNVFQYAFFLYEHGQFPKAVYYFKKYLNEFSDKLSFDEKARTLNNLAVLHSKQNEYEEASKTFEEVLELYRNLAEDNPQAYLSDVATILNNLAVLHENQNEYEKASYEYEEALLIRRNLARDYPQIYLPDVAQTLNNLANLHRNQNKHVEASREFEEALEIYRNLAANNAQDYLSYVALTLNNLAVLHEDRQEYEKALKEHEEALEIYRKLAGENPQAFLYFLATTLNNLAGLHWKQNEFEKTSKEIEEALSIRRSLAAENPQAFLPAVAMALNNLAILHQNQNELEKASKEYEEALEIKRDLHKEMPDVFTPDLALTLLNLAIFYRRFLPEREKSLAYAAETIILIHPLVKAVPFTQSYMDNALDVLREWNLSYEEVQLLIAEKAKEMGIN